MVAIEVSLSLAVALSGLQMEKHLFYPGRRDRLAFQQFRQLLVLARLTA